MSRDEEFDRIVADLDLALTHDTASSRAGRVLLRGSSIELDLHAVEQLALSMTIDAARILTVSGEAAPSPAALYGQGVDEAESPVLEARLAGLTASLLEDLDVLARALSGEAVSLLDVPPLCRALTQLRTVLHPLDNDTARAVSLLAGLLLGDLLGLCS